MLRDVTGGKSGNEPSEIHSCRSRGWTRATPIMMGRSLWFTRAVWGGFCTVRRPAAQHFCCDDIPHVLVHSNPSNPMFLLEAPRGSNLNLIFEMQTIQEAHECSYPVFQRPLQPASHNPSQSRLPILRCSEHLPSPTAPSPSSISPYSHPPTD
jgi:hypothetical protein